MEDAIATRRRKWRGGEDKERQREDCEGSLELGTGNRNEKLVPGNFIGAKGRRGEAREEDGGG